MSPDFLGAVIDTLVPGDDGDPPLPSGTTAGVAARLATRIAPHRSVLDEIARAGGGEDAFAGADAMRRAEAVRAAERAMPDAFAALLLAVVEEYYDADPVIVAIGWRLEPPHPNGHPLPAFDETPLASVKRRGPVWRDPTEGRS